MGFQAATVDYLHDLYERSLERKCVGIFTGTIFFGSWKYLVT